MSGPLSYATALMLLLSLAAAGLARLGFLNRPAAGRWWRFLATVALVIPLSLVRVDGLSAVNLVLSLSPSLSVLTLGLLLHNYMKDVFGLSVLTPAELLLWAGFVLLVSLPLYASVLGFIPVDLYAHGYQFSWVHGIAVGFGLYVAWRGHAGLTVMILGVIVAQYLRALPSGNLFDALTDGIALVLAVAIVAQYAASVSPTGVHRNPFRKRGKFQPFPPLGWKQRRLESRPAQGEHRRVHGNSQNA